MYFKKLVLLFRKDRPITQKRYLFKDIYDVTKDYYVK